MLTINKVVTSKLCISCGICAGICDKKAIEFVWTAGMYYPVIDSSRCTQCGLCYRVCPGVNNEITTDMYNSCAVRQCASCFVSWSRKKKIHHFSASGGTISTIIQTLLENGKYDCVFSVASYTYNKFISTEEFFASDFSANSAIGINLPKSRYIPISHQKSVEYIVSHPSSRVILIGTPCAINGLLKLVSIMKLKRENYLFNWFIL
jgi:coenzyme F420 hydrogenase subunit beta